VLLDELNGARIWDLARLRSELTEVGLEW